MAAAEIEILRLNDAQVQSAISQMGSATRSMTKCCLGLICAFDKFDNENPHSTALRQEVADTALAFRAATLPLAVLGMTAVKNFVLNYVAEDVEYDEWVEDLPSYVAQAEQLSKIFTSVIHMCQDMCTDITVSQKNAGDATVEIKLEMEKLDREIESAEGHRDRADTATSIMLFIPVVGWLGCLVSGHVSSSQGSKVIAKSEENKRAALAIKSINGVLLPAAQDFVSSLKDFAGFFAVVASDLAIAQDRMEKLGEQGPLKSHFRVLRESGRQLVKASNDFTEHYPQINSDLGAVEIFLENKGIDASSAALNWLRKPKRGSESWVGKLGQLIVECKQFASDMRKALGDGTMKQIGDMVPAAKPKPKPQDQQKLEDKSEGATD